MTTGDVMPTGINVDRVAWLAELQRLLAARADADALFRFVDRAMTAAHDQALADAALSDLDPLAPPNLTAEGQTFRDWIDFVDRVARPLVEDDADWDGELGDLYRKASPHFICVSLLMAYNRAYPQPTRFDPDDRRTWPEDGGRVLVFGDGWWGCTFGSAELGARGYPTGRNPCWRHDGSDSDAWFDAASGDLWLPLPPTPEAQG